MGEYFKVVNLSKRQYLDAADFAEDYKAAGILRGLHGVAVGLLLADPRVTHPQMPHPFVAHPLVAHPLVGDWKGDVVVITGDYAPLDKTTQTSLPERERSLYELSLEEYQNISPQALAMLCALDPGWRDHLVRQTTGQGVEADWLLMDLMTLALDPDNPPGAAGLATQLGADCLSRYRELHQAYTAHHPHWWWRSCRVSAPRLLAQQKVPGSQEGQTDPKTLGFSSSPLVLNVHRRQYLNTRRLWDGVHAWAWQGISAHALGLLWCDSEELATRYRQHHREGHWLGAWVGDPVRLIGPESSLYPWAKIQCQDLSPALLAMLADDWYDRQCLVQAAQKDPLMLVELGDVVHRWDHKPLQLALVDALGREWRQQYEWAKTQSYPMS